MLKDIIYFNFKQLQFLRYIYFMTIAMIMMLVAALIAATLIRFIVERIIL